MYGIDAVIVLIIIVGIILRTALQQSKATSERKQSTGDRKMDSESMKSQKRKASPAVQPKPNAKSVQSKGRNDEGKFPRLTVFPEMTSPESEMNRNRRDHLAGEGEDPCHDNMLHPVPSQMRYHDVPSDMMEGAGEGEDPCHIGSIQFSDTDEWNDADDAETLSADHEDMALQSNGIFSSEGFRQNIVQGIILSEILTRPADRRRKGKRQRKERYG